MFFGRIYSPANPIQGAAYSTYGYKPSGTIIARSVGDQVLNSTYVTRETDGSLPTFSLENGVLTFSCPQTHPYIGIGDIVHKSVGPYVYLTRKISTRQWEVSTYNGEVPYDHSGNIERIDKVYSNLIDALSDTKSEIGANIASNGYTVYFPCYEKSSYTSNTIDVTGWTTSNSSFIKIYTPTSIAKECNKSQRHTHSSDGFVIESNAVTTLLQCSDDNVLVEGLHLQKNGACTNGIDMQGTGVVSDCKLKDFTGYGILVTESSDDVVVARNIVHGSAGKGIGANASSKVIQNTVHGYPVGYEFTAAGASTYCANCLAASNATNGFVTPPAAFYNSASDDATATGTNCVTSAALDFYDAANGDFRLTNANNTSVMDAALDLSKYSLFAISEDIEGNPVDSTPTMGALEFVRVVPYGIGNTLGGSVHTAASISISNGVVTFSTDQLNPLVSAGYVLTHASGSCILTEKISSTQWRTTATNGLAPADVAGPSAITSILPQFNSLAAFILSGAPTNLVSSDIQIELVCVEKTATSDSYASFTGYTCDETRGITIYTPTGSDSKSNSNRRHAGVWDNDLMYVSGIQASSTGGYFKIIGMQLDDDIYLLNAISRVEANIVKEAGIQVISETGQDSKIAVLSNVVYDNTNAGILIDNYNTDSGGYLFAIFNNTVYNCGYGIKYLARGSVDSSAINQIRLLNNLMLQNGIDLEGDEPTSDYITSESNWTSDSTGLSLKLDRNNDALKTVTFRDVRDFHIPFAQQILMSSGYAANVDHFFQAYIDIDSETRPETYYNEPYGWSIGADQYSLPTKNAAYFSVGHNSSDLQSGSVNIDVVGGIATFSASLDSGIGIGDKVTTPGGDVYLAEKGSASIWRVVDNTGGTVANFSNTVTDIKRVSNALHTALSTDISAEFGSKDLVTNTADIKIECYQDDASADTSTVTVSGWTTSSTYFMTIEAPFDTLTQCNTRQRHSGAWLDTRYRIETSAAVAIAVSNQYIHIDGLQIKAASSTGVAFSSAGGSSVKRCIIKDSTDGVTQDTNAYVIYAKANIIYDTTTVGLDIKNGYSNNNTIVSDNGTAYTTQATAALNNDIAQGSATGYSGGGSISNCISEDATGTITSVTLSFAGTDDYHLARNDFEALNQGAIDSNNPTRDIDSELIPEYSIGADCQDLTTTVQTFSCGTSTDNKVLSLTGLTVTISGNVATFSTDISDSGVIIGDTLLYDIAPSTKTAYLKNKISDTSWTVVNDVGEIPEAASGVLVISIKRTFNYVEKVYDSTDSESIAQFSPYGDATNPMTDLVKAKLQISIAMDKGSNNIEPAVISGFTTDEDNYLRLYAPYETDECYSTQRHDGVYDSYARMIYSSTTLQPMVDISCDYTEIDGILISVSGASTLSCIYVNASNCKIINNIIFNGKHGIECVSSDLKSKIVNNIIYDFLNKGILASLTDYIYSNTIDDCDVGIYSTVLCNLTNNIVQNCPSGCYGGVPNTRYCMAEDASTGGGTGDLDSTTAEFEDVPNRNYNLTKDSPRGVGTQLNGDTTYPFDTDAVGNARGRFWDMGALEYQAKKVFFSVGDITQNYHTASAAKATVIGSIITFGTPQTNDKIASGDVVITGVSTVIGYLGEKIDSLNWYISDENGDDAVSGEHLITIIKRKFSNLPSAFSGGIETIVGSDLTSAEVQVNIVVSDDSVGLVSSACTISGYTCDVDYFIRIFSPIDITKHCNVPHRHKGNPSSGSEVLLNDLGYAINVNNARYIEISGIILENSNANGGGIYIQYSKGFLIDSNIIHECGAKAIHCDCDDGMVNGIIYVIVNNILSRCIGGISMEGGYTNYVWVMNNTIVNCYYGIYQIKSSGLSTIVQMYNNICQDNVAGDFIEDHPENTGKFLLLYNISRDVTAGTNNGNINKQYIKFIDRLTEDYTPDLDVDSVAINSAYDLRETSPYYFFEDCRGVDREEEQWDRGAIEQSQLIGTGSLQIGPVSISNQFGIATDEFPTQTLYLRDNFYDSVSTIYQFHTITTLNAYLATNTIDNILIYVEANKTFEGMFEFDNREDRTVKVMTDPNEAAEGPASIRYNSDGLFDDDSKQGSLTFENIKIYSVDSSGNYSLNESHSALTSKIILINCIVQVNNDTLVNSDTNIEIVNSIVLYFNDGSLSTMYLAKTTLTGHKNYNSIFICDESSTLTFKTCTGSLDDYMYNGLTYNIGSGDFDIGITSSRVVNPQENEDPEFTEIESFSAPSTVMTQSNLKPLLTSIVANTGNDSAVTLYSMTTDIEGSDRQFRGGFIDIGPYELAIHIFDLESSDVRSVDQIRIDLDRENKRLICLKNDTVYEDLYARFQYNQDELEEFIREQKIAIQLKAEPSILLKTDKVRKVVEEFTAYYDAESMTIIATKINSESPFILGRMLDDDRYSLYFNEQENKLQLLLNEAVTLCISGAKNPIKNVKFGGGPIFNL